MSSADWQYVEASRDFAHSLEAIRRVSPTEITQKLAHQRDVHAVEGSLRDDFADHVGETAGWLPDRWHKAMHWFGALPLLQVGEFNSANEWRKEWIRSVPNPKQAMPLLSALGPIVTRYLGPAHGAGDPAASDWSQTEARLEQRFRKHAQTPIAAFAYLGLLALDHERLRGLLVSRMLFSEGG